MPDQVARKAAQQRLEDESFDAQVGGPLVVYLHTAIDIAEEYESALAPMREALQAAKDQIARYREQLIKAGYLCEWCGEPVKGSVHYEMVSGHKRCCRCMKRMEEPTVFGGPVGDNVARAAEVLKGQ